MKVVFLDRDGVINEFPGNGKYVTKLKEFHFVPGTLDALRILTQEGYSIYIVSNQAGVAKGVYSKQKLEHITRNMLRDVRAMGGRIKKVFYCTHFSHAGCECRKPEIGAIRQAFELANKTIHSAQKAFFVGDTESDILTGHNAGCTTIFVLSGREDRRHMRGWKIKPDYVARDLLEATDIINERNLLRSSQRKRRALTVKSVRRRSNEKAS
ncbi:MAG: HAD-IIIA family hydrolase [Candidatus Omnitrophica bacterium]|nr:HAD-IIIA family hydrolase [Candidatus Omnitrophota bacterium]